MACYIKPIPFKPPRLIGLSEALLASHYENNYGGALRRLNAIEARLANLDWPGTPGYEVNGLKREHLVAANSVVLHEVYFDSLGGADGLGSPTAPPTGDLARALERDFGSVAGWAEEFAAMGKALGGGSGWVILSWSPRRGSLVNHWAGDHTHAQVDCVPILALDMYEHAYHMDFGADAAAYVDSYLQNLHWGRPARRFAQAIGLHAPVCDAPDDQPSIDAEALQQLLAGDEPPLVLDIRLAEDRAKQRDKLPGAQLLARETMSDWIDTLPRDRTLVAYCVYGFQVSGDAVAEMQRRGHAVRRLAGGIAAWHGIGAPTELV